MRGKFVLGLMMLTVLGVGVAGSAPTQLDILTQPNSCVIHCPKRSAFPELIGAVGCADGTTAVCQCGDPSRRMAYCEIRRP